MDRSSRRQHYRLSALCLCLRGAGAWLTSEQQNAANPNFGSGAGGDGCGGGNFYSAEQVCSSMNVTGGGVLMPWKDKEGDGCDRYQHADDCTKFGGVTNFGLSVSEACCACGGGAHSKLPSAVCPSFGDCGADDLFCKRKLASTGSALPPLNITRAFDGAGDVPCSCTAAWVGHDQDGGKLQGLDDCCYFQQSVAPFAVLKLGILTNPCMPLYRIVLAACAALVAGAMSAGAGVGGGGIFVPLFAFGLGVGAKAAVPLSKSTILGVAIGNNLVNLRRRHPNAHVDRPLVNFDMAVYMQPVLLLGTVIGVILNVVVPAPILLAIMAFTLAFMGKNTVAKAKRAKTKEDARLGRLNQEFLGAGGGGTELEGGVNADEANPGQALGKSSLEAEAKRSMRSSPRAEMVGLQTPGDEIQRMGGLTFAENGKFEGQSAADVAELEEMLRSEMQPIAWNCVGMLMFMQAFIMLYAAVRGEAGKQDCSLRGDGCHRNCAWLPSFMLLPACPSAAFDMWFFLPVLFFPLCTIYKAIRLVEKQAARQRVNYQACEGDQQWTAALLKKTPLVSLAAGTMSGMLGVGGGMITGPLFLSMGFLPEVASATTGFMLFFTAASTTTQFLLSGHLTPQFYFLQIAIGFTAGFVGAKAIGRVVKKTGRSSIIIFMLGGIICSSSVILTVGGLYKLHEGEDSFKFAFSMCRLSE